MEPRYQGNQADPAATDPPVTDPAVPGQPQPAADHGGGPAPSGPAQNVPAGTQPATEQPATGRPAHHVVRRTRAGGLWVGLALSALVLLLLLVFILENQQSADIGYFGAHGHLPLGVALLLAAVAGALLVVIPGSARIMQLRATARRHRSADTQAQRSAQQPPAPPGRA